ncbi:unnamed protein product [Bathycoccus prasinos]
MSELNGHNSLEEIKKDYEEQIAHIRCLKRVGASPEVTRLAREVLMQIKSKYLQRRNNCSTQCKLCERSWSQYPSYMKIPVDEEGYTESFEPPLDKIPNLNEALSFFSKYGFVVFRSVISSESCAATVTEIWDELERTYKGVSRTKPSTHAIIPSETYGLASKPAVFTCQILKNRIEPNIRSIFEVMLNSKAILLSHDRWCFYQKTKMESFTEFCSNKLDTCKTASNLHVDLNPWSFFDSEVNFEKLKFSNLRDFSKEINGVRSCTGPHIQGVLALVDNTERDGGTLLVPGFHSTFSNWCNSLGNMKFQVHDSCARTGEENNLIWRGRGSGSYKFGCFDPIHSLKQRITLRAGSMLVWDQRVAHGAAPNDSEFPRFAQFIKAFRKDCISVDVLNSRAASIKREIAKQEFKNSYVEELLKVLI